jgi:hypothetical protein
MLRLAQAAILGAAVVALCSSGAEARAHHYHFKRHTGVWAHVPRAPEWPHSTFYGPRWTGDRQPWYKSDGSTLSAPPDAPTLPRQAQRAPRSFAERHEAMVHPARFAASGAIGPRPHAWCGWYMRTVKGVQDVALNLAANWARWGHASGPVVGAVAVWRHHVGEIAEGSCPQGRIMLHSGNDGHAVRTRCVPARGIIAFREA